MLGTLLFVTKADIEWGIEFPTLLDSGTAGVIFELDTVYGVELETKLPSPEDTE